MKERYFHEEEQFHSRDRKQFRKERRRAKKTDRSKYKKSDVDQSKMEESAAPDDPRLRRGRVLGIAGENIRVDIDNAAFLCTLKGLMKKEKTLSKNLIAVGDLVRVLPVSAVDGAIVGVEERYSILSRLDISGNKEQIMAVNIDQALIVASLHLPPLKPALIDRYLIAAERGRVHPVIVINKIDLLQKASTKEKTAYCDFLSAYEPLGLPIISISARTGIGLDHLRAIMQNKASVFAGQSGVGKSSILNAAFDFDLKTGDLAQKTSKGSHATTVAELLRLPQGGFCIDTPGVRSFGVWDLKPDDIASHFREFHPFAAQCRYPDCRHLSEPACAVKTAVEQKKISRIRYESYQSLMDEIIGGLDHRTKRKLDL